MSGIEIAESRNVELVAYHAAEKRPPFKFAMQQAGGRWYLYCSHLWHCGWSIFDVTDPYRPELLNWIAGPSNTWTIQIQVAEGKMITGLEKIAGGHDARAPAWGHDPASGWEEGMLVWDVSSPAEPRRLGQFRTGGVGTHRNFYAGGRYVHLAANMAGFKGHIYVAVDISDPSDPRAVSRWWCKGQHLAAGETEPTLASLHGPPYVVGGRAWLSYGREGAVLLDISDVASPRLVSRFAIGDFGSVLGVHTYLPIPERNLAVVSTEAILEDGRDSANLVALLDVSDEAKPRAVSILPVPAPDAGAPYRSYYAKGGKFGPHNVHMPHEHPCYAKLANLLHVTYFNAGLRLYDIRDPCYPREVGYFVPADPPERLGQPAVPTRLVTQYEEVLVDARGFIYVSDKNYGLTILRYTGPQLD
jgi:hypothetical protein